MNTLDLNRLAQYVYEGCSDSKDLKLSIAMTGKAELVHILEVALERLGHTQLEGATVMPREGRSVAGAGEFAAAWNAKTPREREDLVVQLLHHQETANRCYQADHDEAVAQLVARRNDWLVLYWHDNCPECEAHAESAIAMAKVSGSLGSTYQETEVTPYDRAGDPTFKPNIAHGAKVRRAV